MVFGVLSAVFVDYKEIDRARKDIQMEFSKIQHQDFCQEGSMAERRACFKRRKESERHLDDADSRAGEAGLSVQYPQSQVSVS